MYFLAEATENSPEPTRDQLHLSFESDKTVPSRNAFKELNCSISTIEEILLIKSQGFETQLLSIP
ncbi:hypothetical protein Tco_0474200, partial [Tanacetum coccineum]